VSHPAVKLVILDEPTSSLGSREAAQLRDYIKRRRSEGVAFIFISHRLQESLDLADRIVVMRNGSVAWSGKSGSISHTELIELLGGRLLERAEPLPAKIVRSAPIVEVHRLRQGLLRDVDLVADRGEIVGLAGLEGSGQRELLRTIFHSAGRPGDSLSVQGRAAFVSGDRATEGVFPLWSIDENIAISTLGRFSRWGLIARSKVAEVNRFWFSNLRIRAESGEARVLSLSGGNQQKAVIARALATEADLILLDDPTRGVDVGTKADLYQLFRGLASQGRTLLWYSSDDTEFAQCDRTLVMSDGAIVAEFSREEVTEERLVEASFRTVQDGGETSFAHLKAGRARRREGLVSTMIPLVTFAFVLAICAMLNPRILSPFGLSLVFSAAFALTFAATSQLFIIAAGDIDLGLGTFIGMVNAVAATWLVSDPWLAALCFLGMLLAYPLMGLFIDMRRVPAIIVTLGLSFVWVGLAALRLPRAGGSAPDWLVDTLRVKIPFVPLAVLLCVLPAAIAYFVLMVSRYGVVLRGYGASPKAIEAAGWSTRAAKASLYGFAGLFAFLTGILVTASTRGGDPTGSTSMTLLSVAAVILGGAAFSGGIVAPIGALFGTLTLVLVGTLLSLVGADAVFLPMVQGLLLLAVIGIRVLLIGRSSRQL
jgi:ribose transport system ATP-binding protein